MSRSFRSTYRLQLHKDFTFADARKILGYLSKLGISHVYLSPILESVEGSNHGYDGVNPTVISAERGGEEEFESLVRRISQDKSLEGLILDIVPNHLATHSSNPAWWDVLRNGKQSSSWKIFDIKKSPKYGFKIVLPVLGRSLQAVIASRELKIGIAGEELVLKYFDHIFPVKLDSYPSIFIAAATELSEKGEIPPWMKQFKSSKRNTPQGAVLAKKLTAWLSKNKRNALALEKSLLTIPVKTLEKTLVEQNYVLRDWRAGTREINYRRFFDINDLVGMRIEDEKVFRWAHSKIADLLKKYSNIHGLRVDHVDGLAFPEQYLKRLAKECDNVWVEKILGNGELMPQDWKILGSTGYEFSVISARLFVDVPGLLNLHSHYLRRIDDRWELFHDCVYDSKREMLESYFVAEVNYLVDLFYSEVAPRKRKLFSREDLAQALIEVTSSLRVYRTYAKKGQPTKSRWLEEALSEAEARGKISSKAAFEWLRSLLLSPSGKWSDGEFTCIKRWEQLTGPVMAKGLEDTALYRYCPLLSLNGVGGEPDWVGDGSLEYHRFQQEQVRNYPYNLNTTSTHDTKRSEDVRSRIDVLSEVADEWNKLSESLIRQVPAEEAPSRRAVYLISETIIGAWPFDGKIDSEFIERMQKYFIKAARESKTETSWSEVNESYEKKLNLFVERILNPKTTGEKHFLKAIENFADRCSYYGAINSLAILALKVTSTGVADFYQGCDLWDLSLVDPDNRRPVNYEIRSKMLSGFPAQASPSFLKRICTQWRSGEIKLWLTWRLLQERNRDIDLFIKAEHIALYPQGSARSQFVSFMRHFENRWMMVVVPRFLANKEPLKRGLSLTNTEILDVRFDLPSGAPHTWRHALTGKSLNGTSFRARDLVSEFPLAVLFSE
ncbi:MAG TPA: malto-oligosyltrehalose synthase [Bdellovibrio sp.]|uniref:malto-oligosyltrehalose synthase n=1 Tax=Bdellovibrio sp. TaxID=28201 RepID=UPI002EEDFD73